MTVCGVRLAWYRRVIRVFRRRPNSSDDQLELAEREGRGNLGEMEVKRGGTSYSLPPRNIVSEDSRTFSHVYHTATSGESIRWEVFNK